MTTFETTVKVRGESFVVTLKINETCDDFECAEIQHSSGPDATWIESTEFGQEILQAAYEAAWSEGRIRKWRA